MKEAHCYECREWFDNFDKHLREIKHRCKLYQPDYDYRCKYKNCIKYGVADNYCLKHLPRMIRV